MKKTYTLPDGNQVTLDEIMSHSGCKRNTAHTRVHKANTIEDAFKPVNKAKANRPMSAVEVMYGSMPDELYKLMFGKWTS